MTWRKLIKLAKKEYGLKKLIWSNKDVSWLGQCNYETGVIILYRKNILSFEDQVTTLFHELGHIHCYNKGIWKNYHTGVYKPLEKYECRKLIKVALKSERWIDNWAEKQCNKYFPNIIYEKNYKSNYTVKLFKTNFLKQYKEYSQINL